MISTMEDTSISEVLEPDAQISEDELQSKQGNGEAEEVKELHGAVGRFLAKIEWHEGQISALQQQIKIHETDIQLLRESLRVDLGPLMGQSLKVRAYDEGDNQSVSEMIIDCLRHHNKPMNTQQIKEYLETRQRFTNPSVELSRMVKHKRIIRAARGLYQLKK